MLNFGDFGNSREYFCCNVAQILEWGWEMTISDARNSSIGINMFF